MIDGGNALAADVRDQVVPVAFSGTALKAALFPLEKIHGLFPGRFSNNPVQSFFPSQDCRLSNPVKV